MNNKGIIDSKNQNIINNSSNKSFYIIAILIVLGVITGIILSSCFLNDANQSIAEWNKGIDEWNKKWENNSWGNNSRDNASWGNHSWENTSWDNAENDTSTDQKNNTNWSGFYQYLTPLTFKDVLLPIVSVILLSISSFFLLGLNITYGKIYKDTKSKYILGLLFVLIPLLMVSIFLIRVTKSLFFSSALKFSIIEGLLGFGITGLGGMLSLISVFMIIGLGILIYLSNQ